MGWFSKLKQGLQKSSSKLTTGIKEIFTHRKVDQDTLDELEELLITTDMGPHVAMQFIDVLAKKRFGKETTTEEIQQDIAEEIEKLLDPVAKKLEVDRSKSPYIIMVSGVNGTGKTTTIGKLANYYGQQGLKVMVAACDTFRAAAVEQLKVWSERSGCLIYSGKENADPASVAFDAIEQAKQENCDLIFIDTAGRLHNREDLMASLQKMRRVIGKHDEVAPHATLLILDATTGQNAIQQTQIFQDIIQIDGLIMTKLDGTAKGGILVALAEKFSLPIYAIGVGEQMDDLQPFQAKDFAQSLVK